MRIGISVAVGMVTVGLAGCITDKMTLTNDQGETKTCEFTGRAGIVSGAILHGRFKKCVDQAKADGYKESSTASK
jgi:hypothetical protein